MNINRASCVGSSNSEAGHALAASLSSPLAKPMTAQSKQLQRRRASTLPPNRASSVLDDTGITLPDGRSAGLMYSSTDSIKRSISSSLSRIPAAAEPVGDKFGCPPARQGGAHHISVSQDGQMYRHLRVEDASDGATVIDRRGRAVRNATEHHHQAGHHRYPHTGPNTATAGASAGTRSHQPADVTRDRSAPRSQACASFDDASHLTSRDVEGDGAALSAYPQRMIQLAMRRALEAEALIAPRNARERAEAKAGVFVAHQSAITADNRRANDARDSEADGQRAGIAPGSPYMVQPADAIIDFGVHTAKESRNLDGAQAQLPPARFSDGLRVPIIESQPNALDRLLHISQQAATASLVAAGARRHSTSASDIINTSGFNAAGSKRTPHPGASSHPHTHHLRDGRYCVACWLNTHNTLPGSSTDELEGYLRLDSAATQLLSQAGSYSAARDKLSLASLLHQHRSMSRAHLRWMRATAERVEAAVEERMRGIILPIPRGEAHPLRHALDAQLKDATSRFQRQMRLRALANTWHGSINEDLTVMQAVFETAQAAVEGSLASDSRLATCDYAGRQAALTQVIDLSRLPPLSISELRRLTNAPTEGAIQTSHPRDALASATDIASALLSGRLGLHPLSRQYEAGRREWLLPAHSSPDDSHSVSDAAALSSSNLSSSLRYVIDPHQRERQTILLMNLPPACSEPRSTDDGEDGDVLGDAASSLPRIRAVLLPADDHLLVSAIESQPAATTSLLSASIGFQMSDSSTSERTADFGPLQHLYFAAQRVTAEVPWLTYSVEVPNPLPPASSPLELLLAQAGHEAYQHLITLPVSAYLKLEWSLSGDGSNKHTGVDRYNEASRLGGDVSRLHDRDHSQHSRVAVCTGIALHSWLPLRPPISAAQRFQRLLGSDTTHCSAIDAGKDRNPQANPFGAAPEPAADPVPPTALPSFLVPTTTDVPWSVIADACEGVVSGLSPLSFDKSVGTISQAEQRHDSVAKLQRLAELASSSSSRQLRIAVHQCSDELHQQHTTVAMQAAAGNGIRCTARSLLHFAADTCTALADAANTALYYGVAPAFERPALVELSVGDAGAGGNSGLFSQDVIDTAALLLRNFVGANVAAEPMPTPECNSTPDRYEAAVALVHGQAHPNALHGHQPEAAALVFGHLPSTIGSHGIELTFFGHSDPRSRLDSDRIAACADAFYLRALQQLHSPLDCIYHGEHHNKSAVVPGDRQVVVQRMTLSSVHVASAASLDPRGLSEVVIQALRRRALFRRGDAAAEKHGDNVSNPSAGLSFPPGASSLHCQPSAISDATAYVALQPDLARGDEGGSRGLDDHPSTPVLWNIVPSDPQIQHRQQQERAHATARFSSPVNSLLRVYGGVVPNRMHPHEILSVMQNLPCEYHDRTQQHGATLATRVNCRAAVQSAPIPGSPSVVPLHQSSPFPGAASSKETATLPGILGISHAAAENDGGDGITILAEALHPRSSCQPLPRGSVPLAPAPQARKVHVDGNVGRGLAQLSHLPLALRVSGQSHRLDHVPGASLPLLASALLDVDSPSRMLADANGAPSNTRSQRWNAHSGAYSGLAVAEDIADGSDCIITDVDAQGHPIARIALGGVHPFPRLPAAVPVIYELDSADEHRDMRAKSTSSEPTLQPDAFPQIDFYHSDGGSRDNSSLYEHRPHAAWYAQLLESNTHVQRPWDLHVDEAAARATAREVVQILAGVGFKLAPPKLPLPSTNRNRITAPSSPARGDATAATSSIRRTDEFGDVHSSSHPDTVDAALLGLPNAKPRMRVQVLGASHVDEMVQDIISSSSSSSGRMGSRTALPSDTVSDAQSNSHASAVASEALGLTWVKSGLPVNPLRSNAPWPSVLPEMLPFPTQPCLIIDENEDDKWDSPAWSSGGRHALANTTYPILVRRGAGACPSKAPDSHETSAATPRHRSSYSSATEGWYHPDEPAVWRVPLGYLYFPAMTSDTSGKGADTSIRATRSDTSASGGAVTHEPSPPFIASRFVIDPLYAKVTSGASNADIPGSIYEHGQQLTFLLDICKHLTPAGIAATVATLSGPDPRLHSLRSENLLRMVASYGVNSHSSAAHVSTGTGAGSDIVTPISEAEASGAHRDAKGRMLRDALASALHKYHAALRITSSTLHALMCLCYVLLHPDAHGAHISAASFPAVIPTALVTALKGRGNEVFAAVRSCIHHRSGQKAFERVPSSLPLVSPAIAGASASDHSGASAGAAATASVSTSPQRSQKHSLQVRLHPHFKPSAFGIRRSAATAHTPQPWRTPHISITSGRADTGYQHDAHRWLYMLKNDGYCAGPEPPRVFEVILDYESAIGVQSVELSEIEEIASKRAELQDKAIQRALTRARAEEAAVLAHEREKRRSQAAAQWLRDSAMQRAAYVAGTHGKVSHDQYDAVRRAGDQPGLHMALQAGTGDSTSSAAELDLSQLDFSEAPPAALRRHPRALMTAHHGAWERWDVVSGSVAAASSDADVSSGDRTVAATESFELIWYWCPAADSGGVGTAPTSSSSSSWYPPPDWPGEAERVAAEEARHIQQQAKAEAETQADWLRRQTELALLSGAIHFDASGRWIDPRTVLAFSAVQSSSADVALPQPCHAAAATSNASPVLITALQNDVTASDIQLCAEPDVLDSIATAASLDAYRCALRRWILECAARGSVYATGSPNAAQHVKSGTGAAVLAGTVSIESVEQDPLLVSDRVLSGARPSVGVVTSTSVRTPATAVGVTGSPVSGYHEPARSVGASLLPSTARPPTDPHPRSSLTPGVDDATERVADDNRQVAIAGQSAFAGSQAAQLVSKGSSHIDPLRRWARAPRTKLTNIADIERRRNARIQRRACISYDGGGVRPLADELYSSNRVNRHERFDAEDLDADLADYDAYDSDESGSEGSVSEYDDGDVGSITCGIPASGSSSSTSTVHTSASAFAAVNALNLQCVFQFLDRDGDGYISLRDWSTITGGDALMGLLHNAHHTAAIDGTFTGADSAASNTMASSSATASPVAKVARHPSNRKRVVTIAWARDAQERAATDVFASQLWPYLRNHLYHAAPACIRQKNANFITDAALVLLADAPLRREIHNCTALERKARGLLHHYFGSRLRLTGKYAERADAFLDASDGEEEDFSRPRRMAWDASSIARLASMDSGHDSDGGQSITAGVGMSSAVEVTETGARASFQPQHEHDRNNSSEQQQQQQRQELPTVASVASKVHVAVPPSVRAAIFQEMKRIGYNHRPLDLRPPMDGRAGTDYGAAEVDDATGAAGADASAQGRLEAPDDKWPHMLSYDQFVAWVAHGSCEGDGAAAPMQTTANRTAADPSLTDAVSHISEWRYALDPNTTAYYFASMRIGTSSWEKPRALRSAEALLRRSLVAAADAEVRHEELLHRWQCRAVRRRSANMRRLIRRLKGKLLQQRTNDHACRSATAADTLQQSGGSNASRLIVNRPMRHPTARKPSISLRKHSARNRMRSPLHLDDMTIAAGEESSGGAATSTSRSPPPARYLRRSDSSYQRRNESPSAVSAAPNAARYRRRLFRFGHQYRASSGRPSGRNCRCSALAPAARCSATKRGDRSGSDHVASFGQ